MRGPLLALVVATTAACGGPQGGDASDSSAGVPPAQVVRVDPGDAPSTPIDELEADARRTLASLAAAGPAEGVRLQHRLYRLSADVPHVLAEALDDAGRPVVVRQASASALGESTDPRACLALDQAALSVTDPRVAVAVAVAAGRCGVLAPLRAVAADGDDLALRLKALIALGIFRDSVSVPLAGELRDTVPSALVPYAAVAQALLGDADAADRVALQAPDLGELTPDIAGIFAVALVRGGVEREDIVPALRVAAVESPDPLVRHEALGMLWDAADRYALTLVTTATSDPSPRVAAFASGLLAATSGDR